MFWKNSIHLLLSITPLCSICATGEQVYIVSDTSTKINPDLLSALTSIGVSMEELTDWKSSGQVGSGIVRDFTNYAAHSDKKPFANLTPAQRGALVLFGFKLLSEKKIADNTIEKLMISEKMRAGLTNTQISELKTLCTKIEHDSSHVLTAPDVTFVRSILPAIESNTFAFADVLGILIGAFIVNEEDETLPLEDDDIEAALTQASQVLSGLSDDQITNITNITQNYQSTGQFEATDRNVSDIDQAMALSFLPLGVFALYPLLGSDSVYEVNNITTTYDKDFNAANVDRYRNQVATGTQNWQRRTPGQNNRPAQRAQGTPNRARSLDRSRGSGANRGDRARGDRERGGGDRGHRDAGGGRGGRGRR